MLRQRVHGGEPRHPQRHQPQPAPTVPAQREQPALARAVAAQARAQDEKREAQLRHVQAQVQQRARARRQCAPLHAQQAQQRGHQQLAHGNVRHQPQAHHLNHLGGAPRHGGRAGAVLRERNALGAWVQGACGLTRAYMQHPSGHTNRRDMMRSARRTCDPCLSLPDDDAASAGSWCCANHSACCCASPAPCRHQFAAPSRAPSLPLAELEIQHS